MNLPLVDRVMELEGKVGTLEASMRGVLEKVDHMEKFMVDLHEAREKVKLRMAKARKGRKVA